MLEHLAGCGHTLLLTEAPLSRRYGQARGRSIPAFWDFALVGGSGRTDNHAMTTPARLEDRRRFVRLLHRGLGLGVFFDAADRALAGVLRFDSACWLSLDPATLLPTSHFTRELGSDHLLELAANEFLDQDVNKFADLARAARPVGILSQATSGELWRSPRHAKVLAPYGYADGDELRAVFLDGGSAWGCVALHRRRGRFHEREAGLVAEVGGLIGQGIRPAILVTALDQAADGAPEQPGLILLRGDGSVEGMTAPASRWLAELVDSTSDGAPLPLLVASVADQARRAAVGQTEQVASARLPRRSGGWLLVDASLLDGGDGRVAVMVYPARQPELASLIAEAYGLSRRERAVTRLVLHGRSTREIAEDLHVSAYTVQDHLKAIFAKVGVGSRRELVAQLFLQHYAPRLQARAEVGTDGWFADASAAERPANGPT
jgi:DNA-binding CsgD family transcriptional regulator